MTADDLLASIATLESRLATMAGVTEQQFADQRARFSVDEAHAELARLKQELALLNSPTGTTTRYAATSKGVYSSGS